ncbi:MAG TPA: DUF6805 domain-containing protein, partial [Paludibacter sp.]|nr:DUF6805 domain-containing protein [Paludibacter sp.]
EQQPEVDHSMESVSSTKGNSFNEFWREAKDGGFFSYKLNTNSEQNLTLMVRYWGKETGKRTFDIFIDGTKLTSECLLNKWNNEQFYNVEYSILNSLLLGKKSVTVKFQGVDRDNNAGKIYYLRLLRK